MHQSVLALPNGALAQLGERLICIQEVIGSIPIGSTIRETCRVRFSAPFAEDHIIKRNALRLIV